MKIENNNRQQINIFSAKLDGKDKFMFSNFNLLLIGKYTKTTVIKMIILFKIKR